MKRIQSFIVCFLLTWFWFSAPAQNNLSAYEYWFNNSYDDRQTFIINSAEEHYFIENIDVSALPVGVNVLNIQYKNENNLYSSTLSKMFYKPPVNQELSENLTGYEMWFNNDYENRQTNSISASTGHHLLTEVDVSALPVGVNVLNIRYKNENNLFSSTLSKMFYKKEQNFAGENAVTAYKYWFDDNYENAVLVQLQSPAKQISVLENLDVSHLAMGEHIINFQFLDGLGLWSLVKSDNFTKTALPTAAFSIVNNVVCVNSPVQFVNESIDTDTWLWNFGDGTTSTEFEPEHAFSETGDFEVSLTATDSESGSESAVSHTFAIHPDYETEESIEICEGETYILGTHNLTSAGEYTEVFKSVSGCDSIIFMTLFINPEYNTTESVTVYEDDLPLQFGSQTLTGAGTYTETFNSVTGCDSTVTLTLTVKPADITPPSIICNSISISLNSSGQYVLNDNDIQDISEGTTDNDSKYEDLTIGVFPNSFSCEEAGTNVPVMVIATDLRENKDTCYTTILVIDETMPKIMCKNTRLVLDENGLASLNPVNVYSSANDACGIQSVTVSRKQFTCNHIGSNTIHVTATDNNNNSQTCAATVTISDNLSPAFNPVEDLTITVNEGECVASISYPEIIATDNCGTLAIVQIEGLGPDEGFPLGTTVERWVATDISGNTDTLSFDITVLKNPANPSVDSIVSVEILQDSGWFTIQITGVYDGSDCEDYTLDFLLTLTNENLLESYTVIHAAGKDTATLKAFPALNSHGSSEATLTVVNSETGKEFSIGFSLSILPENDAPFTVQPVGNLEMYAGDILKVFFNPEKGVIFDDVDENDMLQLYLIQANEDILPEWLVFRNDSLIATPSATDTGCIELVLVATDLSGEVAFSPFTLCAGFPVEINLPENPVVKVYPNPTTGKVYIDFFTVSGNEVDVSIMDILGKKVLRKKYPTEGQIEVDLSDKVSGIYFLKLKTDDGVELNRKIIVSKEK